MRGDNAVEVEDNDVVVIEIDVEGYELQVLSGLDRLLRHRNTDLIIEVLDELLQKGGTTSRELLDFMSSSGFVPHEFDVTSSRFGRKLDVSALKPRPETYAGDLLFLRSESVFSRRLAAHISATAAIK